jgi:heme-degrading monooxygenase HmoA
MRIILSRGNGSITVRGFFVWDSMEKIQAWRANPEYIELRKIGDKYAKFRSFAVEGVPQ